MIPGQRLWVTLERWNATGPKAPGTEGGGLKLKGSDPSEIWGSHHLFHQATEPECRAGRETIRVERSQDHAITGPPFQVLPSISFSFPSSSSPYPVGLGNNKLRLRDGGWRESGGGGKCNKRKGMRAGHQLSLIEGECIYMIREMATLI